MLSKKITVQKSFRIEANMENDLEMLAQKLNRPQNELVNAALNQLMLDNMEWFVEDFLIDLCKSFLEKKVSELDISITGLRIHIIDTGERITGEYHIEMPNFTENCSNMFLTNDEVGYAILKKDLKSIALKIGAEAPEIQEYLHNRFGYIFSRESIIQKFDRYKFIRQSVGLEDEDALYKELTQLNLTEDQLEQLRKRFNKNK